MNKHRKRHWHKRKYKDTRRHSFGDWKVRGVVTNWAETVKTLVQRPTIEEDDDCENEPWMTK